MGVTERVARSRELVAEGRCPSVVARVAGISRQSLYRRAKRPPRGHRRSLSDEDRVILEVACENPTDGTRMVAALAGRELGRSVNRKKAKRLMREHRLLQRHRPLGRRRRPRFFRVERPDQLWHMDMTSISTAEHGWSYLNAIIDCCTREITAWSLDVRCRQQEATSVLEQAVTDRSVEPGTLVLGSDNGTAYTSRAFSARLAELEVTHRRGGYRDPESQAFIESWFSKLKERCIWREEFETLDEAREAIDRYHRPHSRLAYKTPREVAALRKNVNDDPIPSGLN